MVSSEMLPLLQSDLWGQEVFVAIALVNSIMFFMIGMSVMPLFTLGNVARRTFLALAILPLAQSASESPLEQFRNFLLSSAFDGILSVLFAPINFLSSLAVYAISVVLVLFVWQSFFLSKSIPSRWETLSSALISSILELILSQLGKAGSKMVPFFGTLFFTVLLFNLVGSLPFTQTVTASLAISLGLSSFVWLWVTLKALATQGPRFFAHFIPEGTPFALVPLLFIIELVSYCVRALSLGVRLFANMVAGHTLLAILGGFLALGGSGMGSLGFILVLPFALFTGFAALEVGVAFIQSYVFVVLSLGYMRDALIHLYLLKETF